MTVHMTRGLAHWLSYHLLQVHCSHVQDQSAAHDRMHVGLVCVAMLYGHGNHLQQRVELCATNTCTSVFMTSNTCVESTTAARPLALLSCERASLANKRPNLHASQPGTPLVST